MQGAPRWLAIWDDGVGFSTERSLANYLHKGSSVSWKGARPSWRGDESNSSSRDPLGMGWRHLLCRARDDSNPPAAAIQPAARNAIFHDGGVIFTDHFFCNVVLYTIGDDDGVLRVSLARYGVKFTEWGTHPCMPSSRATLPGSVGPPPQLHPTAGGGAQGSL